MPIFKKYKKRKDSKTNASPIGEVASPIVEVNQTQKAPASVDKENLPNISSSSSKKRKSEELQETIEDNKQREAKQKKLEYLLEEFDIEVNSRVQQMQNQASTVAFSLKNALEIELIKLPPRIRNMTMKELLSETEPQVPASAKKEVAKAMRNVTNTVVGATPLQPKDLKTRIRSSRRDAGPTSKNNSQQMLAIEVGGKELEISTDPDMYQVQVKSLSKKSRTDVEQYLLALRANLDSMLSAVQK